MTMTGPDTAPRRPHRSHLDVLADHVVVAGRDAVDIGCGAGDLVRALTKRGARVVGVDLPQPAAAAASRRRTGDERYVAASADAVPLADSSADVVTFFHSLHHVPPARQPTALAEAARLLREHGQVYVVEPLPEGPLFEIMRCVDDETAVLAAAQQALAAAGDAGLEAIAGAEYMHSRRFADFDEFCGSIVAANPDRLAAVEAHAAEMALQFAASGRPDRCGLAFDQPRRVSVLRRSDVSRMDT